MASSLQPRCLRTEQVEAKKRTQIILAMIHYDNLPAVARDIAKEFGVSEINAARKALEIEGAPTEEQWAAVSRFLFALRRRRQERVFELGTQAFA